MSEETKKKSFDELSKEEQMAMVKKGEKNLEEKYGITQKRVEELDEITTAIETGSFLPDGVEGTTSDVAMDYLAEQKLTEAELILMAVASISKINKFKHRLLGMGPVGQMIALQL